MQYNPKVRHPKGNLFRRYVLGFPGIEAIHKTLAQLISVLSKIRSSTLTEAGSPEIRLAGPFKWVVLQARNEKVGQEREKVTFSRFRLDGSREVSKLVQPLGLRNTPNYGGAWYAPETEGISNVPELCVSSEGYRFG